MNLINCLSFGVQKFSLNMSSASSFNTCLASQFNLQCTLADIFEIASGLKRINVAPGLTRGQKTFSVFFYLREQLKEPFEIGNS